jgi:hypothetical protein
MKDVDWSSLITLNLTWTSRVLADALSNGRSIRRLEVLQNGVMRCSIVLAGSQARASDVEERLRQKGLQWIAEYEARERC